MPSNFNPHNLKTTLDKKIKAMIKFKQKYSKAKIGSINTVEVLRQYAKTDEEYKDILEEYEKINRYYEYVRIRKTKGKVKEEQIKRCKKANIGGVFGYSTKVELLAQKYKIKEKEVYHILTNYGSIDNFYNLYKDNKLESDKEIANLIFKDIIDIDGNIRSENYNRLIVGLGIKDENENELILYSSNKLNKELNKLQPKEKIIIERHFGLTPEGIRETEVVIANALELSKSRIGLIKQSSLRKIKNSIRSKNVFTNFYKLKNNILLTDIEKEKILEVEKILDNIRLSNIDLSGEDVKESLKFIEEIKNRIKERAKIEVINLDKINFSSQIYDCLHQYGVNSLQDIINLTKQEIFRLNNFSLKAVNEIIDKLAEYGLHLKEDTEELQLFTTRVRNALIKKNIYTLQDIANLTKENLLRTRNISSIGIQEIIEILKEHGLQLKDSRSEFRDFSTNVYNALIRNNIYTLQELASLTKENILSWSNISLNTLQKIIEESEEHGIYLK